MIQLDDDIIQYFMKGYSTTSYHINIVSYDIKVCHTSLQYTFIFKDH